ncbi:MAG: hypothetical protein LBU89_10285 [Fibromonadaceae bacterium]|jgi:hypothetical protein|nr:hypothetical protein [Fibromonadaceae bacterium]
MSSLKETMLANLREMAKLRNAAHSSMFKFSIKKIWPISLIAPQVDWIRITRMMDVLQTTCKEQKVFLAKEKKNAAQEDLPFLNLLPEYLDSFAKVAELLGRAATYRQDVLERKIKMSIREWNSILKSYNEASDDMATIGIVLFKAY